MSAVANQPATSTRVGRVKALIESGKFNKAARICREELDGGKSVEILRLLAGIYREMGEPKQAIATLAEAVQIEPTDAATRFAYAEALQACGMFREAATEWVAGIEIDPGEERPHTQLATALLQLGLTEAAITSGEHALLVNPASAEARHVLGEACEAAGRREHAIEHYSRSLANRPNATATVRRLVEALRAEGRKAEAREILENLVRSGSAKAEDHLVLSGICSEMGEGAAAVEILRRAIAMRGTYPEAWTNLGVLLRSQGNLTEAERCYRKATTQNPGYAPAWNNLGNLHVEACRTEEADRCYARALAINGSYAEAHTNRALLRLLNGDFAHGWDEYEWRWQQRGFSQRVLARPPWDGSDPLRKTILLHAEQGAGDTIQFIRYARLLRRRGASVVLHCQESLRSLLSGMPELDCVFSGQERAPDFDFHAPLMSLPGLFGTALHNIPRDVPYITVPEIAVPEILSEERHLRVGIVWAGNPGHLNDRNRSVSFELFHPLLQVEGAMFYSLQVGGSPGPVPANARFADLAPYLADYAHTAACLNDLDLVITVDTSVAHLAGALAKPTWLLLPACNDWRWLRDRDDSPWYPSFRLFRQPSLGNWADVMARVRFELTLFLRDKLEAGRSPISIISPTAHPGDH